MKRVGRDLTDALYALLLTVVGQVNLRFDIDQSQHYGSAYAVAMCTAAATAAIALRRRAPLLCALVVAGAVAAPELLTTLTITLWGDFVPVLVAAYAVARYGVGRRAWLGVGVLLAALAVVMLRVPVIGTTSNIPFTFVPFVVTVVAARWVRRQEAQHAEARHRAWQLEDERARLEGEREASIQAAIVEERSRIARELHDIVAHCVSVMVVQAGAADDLLDRSPLAARAPLRSVQETGRQAVVELGRMLGLLRSSADDTPDRAPQPGLQELGELVAQVRRAGLEVDLVVAGEERSLPPGLELTIYRIVQEALTNALKHSGGARAEVRVTFDDRGVRVLVRNDGRAPSREGVGHGLIGMRERVALYGGALRAQPRSGGGFEVDASLPVAHEVAVP
ncbi:MAG: sensor histidine kinase [Nocardioidaceae bacterium]